MALADCSEHSPAQDPALQIADDNSTIGIGERTRTYFFAEFDLNGDGAPERLQYARGFHQCGTGGCTLLILTERDGTWVQIGRLPTVSAPVYVLETKQNGWRDLGYRARIDAFRSDYGVINFNNDGYRKTETDEEFNWDASLPGEMLFAARGWPEEAEPEVRDILREQGFSAPLNGREEILHAGNIEQGSVTYRIYTYRGLHRPLPQGVDHGVNKILVLSSDSDFLGHYSVSTPTECWVQGPRVECATETPPSAIEFTSNGPPAEIWFDGEVVPFEPVDSARP